MFYYRFLVDVISYSLWIPYGRSFPTTIIRHPMQVISFHFINLRPQFLPFLAPRSIPSLALRSIPFLALRSIPFLAFRSIPFLALRSIPFLAPHFLISPLNCVIILEHAIVHINSPTRGHISVSVAQGIEQRFPKPCAACSNHARDTKKQPQGCFSFAATPPESVVAQCVLPSVPLLSQNSSESNTLYCQFGQIATNLPFEAIQSIASIPFFLLFEYSRQYAFTLKA